MSHSEEVNKILHAKGVRQDPVDSRTASAIQYLAGVVDDQTIQDLAKEVLTKISDLEDLITVDLEEDDDE